MPELLMHGMLGREVFRWERSSYESWYAIIIEKGEFYYEMSGKSGTAAENDVVLFPQDVPFYRRITSSPLIFHYIRFEWNIDDLIMKSHGIYPVGRLDFKNKRRLASTISALKSLTVFNVKNKSFYCEHYFRDIWMQYYLENIISIRDVSDIDDAAVSEAVRYIDGSFGEPLTVAGLSERAHMSHINFTRRFTAAVGMTPVAYISGVRLSNAHRLLISTDLTVAEVAEQCGYENQFYFSRCFTKKYGASPLGIRREAFTRQQTP